MIMEGEAINALLIIFLLCKLSQYACFALD